MLLCVACVLRFLLFDNLGGPIVCTEGARWGSPEFDSSIPGRTILGNELF